MLRFLHEWFTPGKICGLLNSDNYFDGTLMNVKLLIGDDSSKEALLLSRQETLLSRDASPPNSTATDTTSSQDQWPVVLPVYNHRHNKNQCNYYSGKQTCEGSE